MYRFEITEGAWFSCPETPDELSLEQFVDLVAVQKMAHASGGTYTTDILMKMVGVCCGIPADILAKLPVPTINHLSELATKALLMEFPTAVVHQDAAKSEIKIGKWLLQPHYSYLKLKHARVMEDWFGNMNINMYERPDYMLALLMREEGEQFDISLIHEKVKQLWHLPMSEVYHPIFWLFKTREELMTKHAGLFDTAKKKKKSNKKSQKKEIMDKWGWHHIANRLVEDAKLSGSLIELDELPMHRIFHQLSYMHDMRVVEAMNEKQAQLNKPIRTR